MSRAHLHVTAAELDVLELLWERGPATIRELAERLYPGRGTAGYATVQKLLDRMESKSIVRRETAGRAHVFHPAVDRSAMIGHRLQETADRLCSGEMAPLLTHLVERADLSVAELGRLRSLIERELGREPAEGEG